MDFIAGWLLETVFASVLDPVVLGIAAVLSLAVFSGLVAGAVEAGEALRLPLRLSRTTSSEAELEIH